MRATPNERWLPTSIVRPGADRVREAGWETVGEIVDFENTFLLCYVRGPEGLIVELAERLDGAPR